MLDVRIWEVGAGLAVRIVTPLGQNHIIDAGRTVGFSPAEHIRRYHWDPSQDNLDYLVISHQDKDHVEDLPNILRLLGNPAVYQRNKSVPPAEKYGSRANDYQKVLASMDERYTSPIAWEANPRNPAVSGVAVNSWMNDWVDCNDNINNASVVVSYEFAGTSIVFPGDLEPDGWSNLATNNNDLLVSAAGADRRIVLAPHHGRESGYSQEIIDFYRPHLVVISDGWGAGATDNRYYDVGIGMNVGGDLRKYVTTKNEGRKRITVSPNGQVAVFEAD